MGVKYLWEWLLRLGCLTLLSTATADGERAVANLLGEAVVALDVAQLVVQATTVQREEFASPEEALVQTLLSRVVKLARADAVVVGVVDGQPPREKLAKLLERGSSGRRLEHGQFESLQRLAAEVLAACGCTVLRSPEGNEGEAYAAALVTAGFATAVLSDDGDAVAFGASCVLKDVGFGAHSVVSVKRFAPGPLRASLRLAPTAPLVEAVAAFAALTGSDYDGAGAKGVGVAKAECVLRAALAPHPSAAAGLLTDADIAARVRSKLEAPSREEEALEALTLCTGCATCGHDGGTKAKRTRHLGGGCAGCGTSAGCTPVEQQAAPVGSAHGGPFGWVLRGGRPTPCGCAFHAFADAREAAAAHREARKTPGFVASFRSTCDVFSRLSAEALAAATSDVARLAGANPEVVDEATGRLTWACRPDIERLADICARASRDGTQRVVVGDREKGLVAQWDVRHPGHPEAVVTVGSIAYATRTTHAAEHAWFYNIRFAPARPGDAACEAAAEETKAWGAAERRVAVRALRRHAGGPMAAFREAVRDAARRGADKPRQAKKPAAAARAEGGRTKKAGKAGGGDAKGAQTITAFPSFRHRAPSPANAAPRAAAAAAKRDAPLVVVSDDETEGGGGAAVGAVASATAAAVVAARGARGCAAPASAVASCDLVSVSEGGEPIAEGKEGEEEAELSSRTDRSAGFRGAFGLARSDYDAEKEAEEEEEGEACGGWGAPPAAAAAAPLRHRARRSSEHDSASAAAAVAAAAAASAAPFVLRVDDGDSGDDGWVPPPSGVTRDSRREEAAAAAAGGAAAGGGFGCGGSPGKRPSAGGHHRRSNASEPPTQKMRAAGGSGGGGALAASLATAAAAAAAAAPHPSPPRAARVPAKRPLKDQPIDLIFGKAAATAAAAAAAAAAGGADAGAGQAGGAAHTPAPKGPRRDTGGDDFVDLVTPVASQQADEEVMVFS